ncbi:unnamed protein product [Aphis gossypii]|uniref:Ubiquitin-like protease family profile domain-containing protein n=1 Tax=Aphis gossypii TaxID=80765 RepID=A0A9P0JCW3_APHGO|nr:unnamed protein product [Aphis gossypii]
MDSSNQNQQYYLTDAVVNDYMQLINTHYGSDVYVFDTFFYLNLCERGFDSVKRWAKKIDLFSKKKLMFPINLKSISHWVLVCADLETKELKYLDSLHGYNVNVLLKLFEYLRKIHMDRVGTPFCTNQWNLKRLDNTLVPKQSNGYDCGVFVCTFAKYLARGAKFNFAQTNMQWFRNLITYELHKHKIVPVDVDGEEIESFIRNVLNGQ